MKKRIFALFTIVIMTLTLCVSCKKQQYKTINFDYFNNTFSPFFVLHTADMSVTAMVHETLMITQGEQGGKILDAYTKGVGIADITLDDSDPRSVICTIKIGDKIKFSDGTAMSADDVIFSMYVYADNDYEGFSGFNLTAIDGLKNYKYNNSLAETITLTDEQLEQALANPDDDLKQLIIDKVINPVLEDELKWVKRIYKDKAYEGTEIGQYAQRFKNAKDLFAFLYADKSYDSSKVASEQQVLDDIKAYYGYDYNKLSTVIGEINLKSAAKRCAEEVITKKLLETLGGEPVNNIRGIQKIDNKTVKVVINNKEDDNVNTVLGIYVAPLHYYGSKDMYDPEKGMFGFTRGDLSSVKAKNTKPMGAGRYVMTEYIDGKTVSFEHNKNYFKKLEVDPKIVFNATGYSAENKTHGYYVTFENYTYKKS